MKDMPCKRVVWLLIISSCAMLCMPAALKAQDVPPGQEPAVQGSRFQAESERKAKELEKKKGKPPPIEVEEKKAAPPGEAMRFILKDVKIAGPKIFKPSDFFSIYKPYIGKEVTFDTLSAIADKIKARYKAKGCLTTAVYIPEQDVVDGIVEIKVVEGEFGKLKIEGNRRFGSSLIKKYIHAKKMRF